jgi:hypothetical protein
VHFPYLLVSRFSLAYCRAVCFFALVKILVENILGGLLGLLVISGVKKILARLLSFSVENFHQKAIISVIKWSWWSGLITWCQLFSLIFYVLKVVV